MRVPLLIDGRRIEPANYEWSKRSDGSGFVAIIDGDTYETGTITAWELKGDSRETFHWECRGYQKQGEGMRADYPSIGTVA